MKEQIRLFYLCEGKRKRQQATLQAIICFPLYMTFWNITQTNILELCNFDTYKSESTIFTPFLKICVQVVIRQHSSPKTERTSACHLPGLYYGNDDRISMSSNILTGMKQRHNRIFSNFTRYISRSETC